MKWCVLSGVPFPRNLKLERQLTKSVLISWEPPEGVSPSDVQSYHVYVDSEFKTSVKGTERTKALLENVDSARVRVSISVLLIGSSALFTCRVQMKAIFSTGFDC